MDRETFARLGWLKAELEAATDAEVIRRALKAYELFEPADAEAVDKRRGPNSATAQLTGDVEHLYIRIPARMKARLDAEHKASGRSYGEQVRQALRVLMQLAREREALKELVSEGGDVNVSNDTGSKEQALDDAALFEDKVAYRKLVALC